MNKLINKKVLLFAPELEKKEHRGIAVYTKALIEALSDSGAEIWLTTSTNLKDLKIKNLKYSSRNYIYTTYILKNFFYGTIAIDKVRNKYVRSSPLYKVVNKILDIINSITKFSKFIFSTNRFKEKNTIKVKFANKKDNPYLRIDKLSFIKNISGFVCLPNFSFLSDFISLFPFRQTIKVNLKSFDFFVASAPLNLISNSNIPIIQTIHDLIPLDYDPNVLEVRSFYKKLKFCQNTKNIFVSKITQEKFKNIFPTIDIKNRIEDSSVVIMQPPSLYFEDYNNIDIYKKILRKINIKPFNYFLFNASIDARKNVLLLIQSFIKSDAQEKGKVLVITGKLKDDDYSKEIRKLIKNNKGIITTGFVNESLKASLYLNALCLLSPTLIEGFGIPVLDACCLGLKCFASDCDSHNEIREFYDFSNYLEIYSPKSHTKWYEIFNNESLVKISDKGESLKNRISRYQKFNTKIRTKFKLDISNLLNNLG